MNRTLLVFPGVALGLVLTLVVVGCSDSGSGGNGTGQVAELPASYVLASEPAGAQTLAAVKKSAKQGDDIVFKARIGGRPKPFVAGRAVVVVADDSLPSCADLHGDTCPTPWDYCCESTESLLANTATVRLADEAGAPLRVSLEDVPGWEPLAIITVVGRVTEKDAAGRFVVTASGVYVAPPG